jgi:hypothetical protein
MRSLTLPTAREDWQRMGRAVADVLASPGWLAVALVASLSILSMFVAVNSPVYARAVVLGGDLSFVGRVRALASLYPLTGADGNYLRGGLLYVTAAVVGSNVAVFGSALAAGKVGVRGGSGGAVGIVFGSLGAGCAPCGLAVAASALSLTGLSAGLTVLPLGGGEFLLVALAVAVLSLHWLVDATESEAAEACEVDP